MNIESFSLRNFKSFGNTPQEIPIKPITLIFGPNSSGKSSILHSLLWMQHSQKTGDLDARFPQGGDGKVDLGDFAKITHRHAESNPVGFAYSFKASCLPENILESWKVEKGIKLELSYGRGAAPKHSGARPKLIELNIEIDGRWFLRAVQGDGGFLAVNELDFEHPAVEPILPEKLWESSEAGDGKTVERKAKSTNFGMVLSTYQDILQLRRLYAFRSFFPNQNQISLLEEPNPMTDDVYEMSCLISSKSPLEYMSSEREKALDFLKYLFPENLKKLLDALSGFLQWGDLKYIPPLRELPPRFFDVTQSGEAWRIISEDSRILSKVNSWIGGERIENRYRLEMETFIPKRHLEEKLPEAFEDETISLLISNPEFGYSLEWTIEDLLKEWNAMDRIAFLRGQPRLMEDLIEYDLTIAETWDDYDDLSEDELRDRAESNVEDIVASESVDDYYVERAFICFLKDNDKLKELLSEFLDLEKSSNRIRSRIVAPHYTHRVELVLRHLDYDTIVSPQDVGIGISQVLPVLVHSMAERRKLIAIEQPEIHIHPALQAELGDVFIESALGENKNRFLLETHSEHLILRILRRIRETSEGELPDGMPPIRPEDVAVLYVKPGEEGAEVIEIPITEDGDFARPWPSGFFTERAKELF